MRLVVRGKRVWRYKEDDDLELFTGTKKGLWRWW